MYETIQTYVLEDINANPLVLNKFDWKDKENRRIVSSCLSLKNKNTYTSKTLVADQPLVNIIFDLPNKEEISDIYRGLGMNTRHDIDHAGVRNNPKTAQQLKDDLIKHFNETKELFDFF